MALPVSASKGYSANGGGYRLIVSASDDADSGGQAHGGGNADTIGTPHGGDRNAAAESSRLCVRLKRNRRATGQRRGCASVPAESSAAWGR